jgi:hypothetical protein
MGLLDDAIREHLELKRKHGADPEDVARQEQEALGPGQRNEFAQPAAEDEVAAEVAPAEVEPVAEPEPEPAPVDELPEGEPEDESPVAAVAAGQQDDPWLDDEPDEVPADEALEPRREPPPADPEDVLEETPDFLQETPEHERLWFEQKPPRDFDWDK